MKKPFSIIVRVVLALILFSLVGFTGYRAGYSQGVANSPAIAEQMKAWQSQAETQPIAPHGFRDFDGPFTRGGYYPPVAFMGRGHFNPLGGLLGLLLLAFVFFGVMRMAFFRGMMHRFGPWQGHMPPWAAQPPAPAPAPAAPQPEAPQPENQ